ncbi:carboxymuconolactone decarboxylase family protein [Pseudoroseomonas wenyumeiae]|uniref:Carboxymuconolactone decarboxylase family protein n=1 Tax=Teichococcus wenyumeiae TaxID=2478470 RepID=A0A3A9K297_9PROT|nr:carboxymuconolactone decarboxylase family protein [Pseudoroseomonas wenyumeiae]RKK05459.1 carboxymuconolactone decarboxylase family protein [Pseudoroseomonas wenyumeiae]RMI19676.1 carboxymuconolactone decarboxylase family protein [Pseudoroseomonas wenyumeiae]
MTSPPRIALPSPEEMSPEQRALYDRIIASPTRRMAGPQRANIHSPELAEAWWRLGDMLRSRTVLPKRLLELAIILAGRRWNSPVEFHIHGAAAIEAGLDPALVEAIRLGDPPLLPPGEEREIYDFTRQVQMRGDADDATYHAVLARWGQRGVVELAAVIGFYTMVCMALNLHRIPLPDGAAAPIAPAGEVGALAVLPPALPEPGEGGTG